MQWRLGRLTRGAGSVHAELDSTWASLISARGEGLEWYLTIAESPYFELEM